MLFELDRLKSGRDEPGTALKHYHHIIIDESQDVAPMELSVIGSALIPPSGLARLPALVPNDTQLVGISVYLQAVAITSKPAFTNVAKLVVVSP